MFNDKNKFQRSNSKPTANVQTSKYQSGSIIKSNEEQNCISINVPNYSVYSSGQNNEVEKLLIDKAELIAFAQCFAQEKISLENTIEKLKEENRLITYEVQRLRQQNENFRSLSQLKSNHNTTQYYEAVESLKTKLKQQFERRLQAERQMHGVEGMVFELRKKNQFLMDKMKHQQDQVQRCEQLLKIKQDIIQNLEWQKANSARNHNKQQKSIKKTIGPSVHKKEMNQTLDLSQIKFSDHHQPKPTNLNSSSYQQINTNIDRNKPKYIINKKPSEQDSTKKLNVSIHKKSGSESVDERRSSNEKPKEEKSRPKGIVLKKHLNNSSFVGDNPSEHKQKEQQYLAAISNLQKQNQTLKAELTQRSIHQVKQQSNTLKQSNQNSHLSQNNNYQLMQKKYNMMRQKCLLLQGQIEKTIRKYLVTEERNNQLQQLIQSSLNNSGFKTSQNNAPTELQSQPMKPGLSLQDLATPQFRESKFNHNFFGKKNNQNHWNHSQFNQISIQEHHTRTNSHLFDTFDKNDNKNQQLTKINERNEISYEKNDLSRQFNEIEDVSEIVCRNEESMAMGDTLDL